MKVFFFIYFLVIGSHLFAQNKITININEIKNEEGTIYISLFKSAEGFPNLVEKAYKKGKLVMVKNLKPRYILSEIPNGNYAISFYHDENGNGKLDSNKIGIPIEGTGNSGNSKTMSGPPKFNLCQFEVKDKDVVLNLNMTYLKFGDKPKSTEK